MIGVAGLRPALSRYEAARRACAPTDSSLLQTASAPECEVPDLAGHADFALRIWFVMSGAVLIIRYYRVRLDRKCLRTQL